MVWKKEMCEICQRECERARERVNWLMLSKWYVSMTKKLSGRCLYRKFKSGGGNRVKTNKKYISEEFNCVVRNSLVAIYSLCCVI